MARYRLPGRSERIRDGGPVPVELLDQKADAWASAGDFQRWCRQHLGEELRFIPLADSGPFHRFIAATERWASINGFDLPGQYGGTDWVRLGEVGIHRPRRRQVLQVDPADSEIA